MDKLSTTSKPQATTDLVVQDGIALAEGLQDFGIDTDLTAEELFDVATQAYSTSLYMAVKAGVAYMAAQKALKTGLSDSVGQDGGELAFAEWIRKNKLTRQRVYEVISLAKGYLAIPAAQRHSYLALGKYKAIKLASIEPEALAELAEKTPTMLDDWALLSRDEMGAQLIRLRVQLGLEQDKNQRLLAQSGKQRLTVFLPRTEDIRAECLALQKEAEQPLNSLRKLFEEVNNDPHSPEWRYQIEQIWLTANVAAAQAADMLHALQEMSVVGDLPDTVQAQHIMTAAEARRWLDESRMIENSYEGKKSAREYLREQAKPKGPGRPKLSPNKAG